MAAQKGAGAGFVYSNAHTHTSLCDGQNTVGRDVQAMDQPVDSREFRDAPFVFNSDKVTAADPGPFCQCFLRQSAVHPCVFDCQSKMYMFIFHYLFISQLDCTNER